MNSIKIKKSVQPYCIIPNKIVQRKDMTMKSKGLLCYLLSLPNDWKIYKTELQNNFKDGKDSVNKAFDELVELGYIQVEESERVSGMFTGNNYTVSDSPLRDNRCGLTAAVNPQLQSNHIKSTHKQTDTKVSDVELSSPTTTDEKIDYSKRCQMFIKKFNDIRRINGKPSRFLSNNSLCGTLRQRLKVYTPEEILSVVKNCMKNDYHTEQKWRYVTPEYVLRLKIIERYKQEGDLNEMVIKEKRQLVQ